MTRLRSWMVLLAIFAGVIGSVSAEILPSKPAGYFNDYANVVDRATALRLNEQLAQFERETSTQLLVAVYQTMQSESSVDDYTQRIAQTWGVGQKGRNNGAVLFVFVQNHQMFIQTGYGLEGALPDATCFDITHNVIAPHFKQNDYAGGLEAGITAMMQAVKGEYKGSGKTRRESEGQKGSRAISDRTDYFSGHHRHLHLQEPGPQRSPWLWLQRLGRSVHWRVRRWRWRLRGRQFGRRWF